MRERKELCFAAKKVLISSERASGFYRPRRMRESVREGERARERARERESESKEARRRMNDEEEDQSSRATHLTPRALRISCYSNVLSQSLRKSKRIQKDESHKVDVIMRGSCSNNNKLVIRSDSFNLRHPPPVLLPPAVRPPPLLPLSSHLHSLLPPLSAPQGDAQ